MVQVKADLTTIRRLADELEDAAESAQEFGGQLVAEALTPAEAFGNRPDSPAAAAAWQSAVEALGQGLAAIVTGLDKQARNLVAAAKGYDDADTGAAEAYQRVGQAAEQVTGGSGGDAGSGDAGSGGAAHTGGGAHTGGPAHTGAHTGHGDTGGQGGGTGQPTDTHGDQPTTSHHQEYGPPQGRNGALAADQLSDVGDGKKMSLAAAQAFREMDAAAHKDGLDLHVNSGYRTSAEQEVLYQRFLAGQGAPADPPGQSKHGLGISADINVTDDRVLNWLRSHAHEFGFVNNVSREPWHWTYMP
jgi:hypothetical protein